MLLRRDRGKLAEVLLIPPRCTILMDPASILAFKRIPSMSLSPGLLLVIQKMSLITNTY